MIKDTWNLSAKIFWVSVAHWERVEASNSLKSKAYQKFFLRRNSVQYENWFPTRGIIFVQVWNRYFFYIMLYVTWRKAHMKAETDSDNNDGVQFLFFILQLSYEIVFTLFIISTSSWAWRCWTILQNKDSNGAFLEHAVNSIKSAVLFWSPLNQKNSLTWSWWWLDIECWMRFWTGLYNFNKDIET